MMTSSAHPTLSFFDTFDCRSGRHCCACRDPSLGRPFRSAVAAYFHLPSADFLCPYSRPWDIADPPAPMPVPGLPTSEPGSPPAPLSSKPGLPAARLANSSGHVSAEEAKRRFTICRACEHSRDNGFACELHEHCCFGRFRASANSRCPTGRWQEEERQHVEQKRLAILFSTRPRGQAILRTLGDRL